MNKETGKHPIFIGPVLIHTDRKYSTYYYFASQLKKLCPDIEDLIAVGTDGEEALSSAFLSVFPSSIHLLCSLHKMDNITRKLREFKVNDWVVKDVLGDIFGSKIDDSYFEGLIDAKESREFMDKLETLKPKWETQCAGFSEWFSVYEAELFCTSMIASVRTAAGLGNPPEGYTTNASESLNVLKRKVNFKRSEWPQFNNVLFDLIREQQEEFEKAVFSQGEYKMVDEYQDLQVTHLNWIQMNSAQRKSKIEKAQKAKLHKDSHVFVEPEQSSSMQISKHTRRCTNIIC